MTNLALARLVFGMLLCVAAWPAAADGFATFLAGVRQDALAQGISAATVDRALGGVRPLPQVIELDRRQAEFTQTFWAYLDKRVTEDRVWQGRAMMQRHANLLAAVQRAYGVQPRFIVAFWGMETNYGGYTGKTPLFAALATLAYDSRRGAFFREQLLAALQGAQRGDIPFDARSSWAGAMGQVQFMPTTYRDYAVDFDGDGRRDLWNSLPDAFASAANYLARSGWDRRHTWGREVRLPPGFDYASARPDNRQPLSYWQAVGVRRIDGRDLPQVNIDGTIVLPGGARGAPALMTYGNFDMIKVWNRSTLYAIAVGHLADRLNGGNGFQTPRPHREVAMSRSEIMEMQQLLAALGYATGEADGIVGSQTRSAIRTFQQHAALPADGHPSADVLRRLRARGGQ